MSRLVRTAAILALAVSACVEFGAPDQSTSTRVVSLDWNVTIADSTLCGPVREIEVRFQNAAETQIHAVDCEDGRAVFASIPETFDHVTVVALDDEGLELDRTVAVLPSALHGGSEVSLSVDILR